MDKKYPLWTINIPWILYRCLTWFSNCKMRAREVSPKIYLTIIEQVKLWSKQLILNDFSKGKVIFIIFQFKIIIFRIAHSIYIQKITCLNCERSLYENRLMTNFINTVYKHAYNRVSEIMRKVNVKINSKNIITIFSTQCQSSIQTNQNVTLKYLVKN